MPTFYGGLGDVVTDPSAPGYDPSQLDPNVAGSAASRSWRQYGRTHNPLHYIDSQLNWRVGAHALAFGVQYKHEALRDDNRNGAGQRLAVLEDARFHNLGAFIQDEWSLRDNVDLVLGARVDKSSELDNAVFSPRIALAWQATPNLKWRAGVATGFRAPEIFVEDVHVDTLGGEQVRVRNTDGLKEERALTTLLGFDWRSDPANPVWSWDATASYARIRDTFALGEIQRGEDGQLSQLRYNASGSNVLGAETNLGWQPSPQWRLTAGASWYRSRFREPQRIFDDTGEGGGTVIESRDYLKTPRWTGLAQLRWMPAEPWETFVALRHTGPMSVLNNRLGQLHRTRAFLVTDLGARWHRHLGAQAQQEVSVAAGVKNVFDQRQKDLETGALRDSDYVYGPRFARSWYVNLRYAF
ncbi:hypothetical protein G6F68_009335 [Rhizopus microsporus]|nr:hypothetical protein G6F68_009335 [Rhizopus microsporus]